MLSYVVDNIIHTEERWLDCTNFMIRLCHEHKEQLIICNILWGGYLYTDEL